MAYAEKPHREYATALRETVNGEITEQLEEHYQKYPDQRQVTWEQKTKGEFPDRNDLLADQRDYIKAADDAVKLGKLRAWGISKRYRQDKEAEESASQIDENTVTAPAPKPAQESTQENVEQTRISEPIYGMARLTRVNGEAVSAPEIDEEDFIRKAKALVESGQITESLPLSKNDLE